MRYLRLLPFLGLLALVPVSASDEATQPKESRVHHIPYKLTIPKHIVVRGKINGKGPFNLVLDTGAPALILATNAAKKAGVEPTKRGWATLERFEIEGGLKMPKTPARIETPFQLEGMNGMGLAGMEIHGLLGYQAVAKFRMEIDFTKDKMVWTEIDNYEPVAPKGLGGKGGSGAGGLEMMGSMMKLMGGFLGRRATPEVTLRGFHGMSLVDAGDHPKVEAVLQDGPAAKAGLQAGDVVKKINGRTVTDTGDVLRLARSVAAGRPVKFTIERNNNEQEITVTTGEGI